MELPTIETVEVNGREWRAVDAEALLEWIETLEATLSGAHEDDPYITLTEKALDDVRAVRSALSASPAR